MNLLLQQIMDPPGQTLLYLLGHALPFLFIPLLSLDTWIFAGPSLLGLFLAQGANDPLSITIRYTLLVVPGFALGALFWWRRRPNPTPNQKTRLAWGGALYLSLLLTVSSRDSTRQHPQARRWLRCGTGSRRRFHQNMAPSAKPGTTSRV